MSIVQLRDVGMSPGDIGKRYGTDPKRITDLLSAACRGKSGMEAVTIAEAASEADRWAAAGAGHDSNLAWLAGLLEGEGSFQSNKNTRLSLEMTDEDVVKRAADLCKAELRGPRRPANKSWSATWSFYLYGQRALDVAETVRPLMGIRRCGQIDRMIGQYRPPAPSRFLRQRSPAICRSRAGTSTENRGQLWPPSSG